MGIGEAKGGGVMEEQRAERGNTGRMMSGFKGP